jgi:hypothetical protein
MNPSLTGAVFAVAAIFASPAAALNPGLYEYVMKMSMPGMPAAIPPTTTQRCLTAKDVEGAKAYEMPAMPNSDCKVLNQVINGAEFSYRVACTKPQKLDGDVKGTATATSLNMDMVMRIPDAPGPMTQNISARRLGDCK